MSGQLGVGILGDFQLGSGGVTGTGTGGPPTFARFFVRATRALIIGRSTTATVRGLHVSTTLIAQSTAAGITRTTTSAGIVPRVTTPTIHEPRTDMVLSGG